MKNQDRTQFLKKLALVVFGIWFAGVMYAQLSIPTNIDNAVQTIREVHVTTNGQDSSTPTVIINGNPSSGVAPLQVSGNVVMGSYTWADANTVVWDRSAAVGGVKNYISWNRSAIIAWWFNSLIGNYSALVWWQNSTLNWNNSAIVSSQTSSLTWNNSIILWWGNNKVNWTYSIAWGKNAQALNDYTWVWSDWNLNYDDWSSDPYKFASSKTWTFLVRAYNGVGINTGNPQGSLDVIAQDGSQGLTVTYTGRVGIGINNPASQLHIKSSVSSPIISVSDASKWYNPSDASTAMGGIKFEGYYDGLDRTSVKILASRSSTNWWVGKYWWDLSFWTRWSDYSASDTTTEKMRILSNGNVGIGTTWPTESLEVAGNIKFNTNGTPVLISSYKAANSPGRNINIGWGGSGNARATWSDGSFNTVVGYSGLAANTYGFQNTAFGDAALNGNTIGRDNVANGMSAMLFNTQGSYNVSNGSYSMWYNTLGNYNAVNGYAALSFNTNGSNNTANGAYALAFNTLGSNNTADWRYALGNNTLGNGNAAVGASAWRYAWSSTWVNANSSSSVYLGYMTKASVDGNTNEVVIWANTVGNGSNTVTLGNTSTTKTLLTGNVGIGTTGPVAKLEVRDMSPSNGAILKLVKNIGLGGYQDILFQLAGGSDSSFIRHYIGPGSDPDAIQFGNWLNPWTIAMSIWSNGNVGIGSSNTAATEKLQVDGNIKSPGLYTKGSNVTANWQYSTAMGNSTNAGGYMSTAIGNITNANWQYSTAMGYGTNAGGYMSTAMGYGTNAGGYYSTAMGYGTTSNGNYTTAMGYGTNAVADSSTAMGNNTHAVADSSTALWKYNIGLSDSILEVWVWSSNPSTGQPDPANALTVLSNGALYADSYAGGSLGCKYQVDNFWFSTYVPYGIAMGWQYIVSNPWGDGKDLTLSNVNENSYMQINSISYNWNYVDSYWNNSITSAVIWSPDIQSGWFNTNVQPTLFRQKAIAGTCDTSAFWYYWDWNWNGTAQTYPDWNSYYVLLPYYLDWTYNAWVCTYRVTIKYDLIDGGRYAPWKLSPSTMTYTTPEWATVAATDYYQNGGDFYAYISDVGGQWLNYAWNGGLATDLIWGNIDVNQVQAGSCDPSVMWYYYDCDNSMYGYDVGWEWYAYMGCGSIYRISGASAPMVSNSSRTPSFSISPYGDVGVGFSTTWYTAKWDYPLQVVGNFKASGLIAKGTWVVADGQYATAIGYKTQANAISSTAMWSQTQANGSYSTAIGYGTTANGDYSTALGNWSIARGMNSTTMWYRTQAVGSNSTAIGYNTVAIGWNSTSMWFNTHAYGDNSTTMWYRTQAVGSNSTAMGIDTLANGANSTAMWYRTQANGSNSTAIWQYNKWLSNSIFEVWVGTSNTPKSALTISNDGSVYVDSDNGVSCLYSAQKLTPPDQWPQGQTTYQWWSKAWWGYPYDWNFNWNLDPVMLYNGSGFQYLWYLPNWGYMMSIINWDMAWPQAGPCKNYTWNVRLGYRDYSQNQWWNGSYYTMYYGWVPYYKITAVQLPARSTSFSVSPYGDVGIGMSTTGYTAVAQYKLDVNGRFKASGIVANGYGATGNIQWASAMWQNAAANAPYSNAMGHNATADGQEATAIGYNTYAKWHNATAIGYWEGVNSQYGAVGDYSTAIGVDPRALGYFSIAIGTVAYTDPYSNYSTAIGSNSQAFNNYSTAIGSNSQASNNYSTAVGYNVHTSTDNSTVIGNTNVGYGDSSFELWAGAYSNWNGWMYPFNSMTVYNNGGMSFNTYGWASYIYSWGDWRSNSVTVSRCGWNFCGYDSTYGVQVEVHPYYDDGNTFYANSLVYGWQSIGENSDFDSWWGAPFSSTYIPSGWYISQNWSEPNGYSNGDGTYTLNYYIIQLYNNWYSVQTDPAFINNSALAISPMGNVAIGSDISHDYSTTSDKLTVAWTLNVASTLKSSGLSAQGSNVYAGTYSTAMGYHASANGNFSTAMGDSTIASGSNSMAMWSSTIASGNFSTAMGYKTIANADYTTAIGKYNVWVSDALLEVGDWYYQAAQWTTQEATVRSNAFTILNNGNVGIGTSSPAVTLDVNGTISASTLMVDKIVNRTVSNITVSGQLLPDTQAPDSFQTIGSLTTGWKQLYANTGNFSTVGIGTTTPWAKLEISGWNFILNTNGTPILFSSNTPWYSGAPDGYNIYIWWWGLLGNSTCGYSCASWAYNVAIWHTAMLSNTIGYQNTAVGEKALRSNTDGHDNTAIGKSALVANTIGFSNTSLGSRALQSNTIGSYNVSIWAASMYYNTTGSQNTVMGYYALGKNTIGANNTVLGYATLYSNTLGVNNTAIGYASLYGNIAGSGNTAIGINAWRFIADWVNLNTNATNSVYLGNSTKALADNATNEVVIGDHTIGNGSNTVTLGNASITKTLLTGNVGIGTTGPAANLHVNSSSSSPTVLISDSSKWYNVSDASTIMGDIRFQGVPYDWIDRPSAKIIASRSSTDWWYGKFWWDLSFWTRWSDYAWTDTSTEKMRILSNGNVGIGTNTPSTKLQVRWPMAVGGWVWNLDGVNLSWLQNSASMLLGRNRTAWGWEADFISNRSAGSVWWFAFYDYSNTWVQTQLVNIMGNGNMGIWVSAPSEKLTVAGNVLATAYYYSSDITLKQNIKSLDNALAKINQLNGYSFSWKSDGRKDIWVIAQEVEKVFPEIVHTDTNGIKSVEYANLVAPIIEAIKSLTNKIDALSTQIQELFNKYVNQEARITSLEQRLQILEARK